MPAFFPHSKFSKVPLREVQAYLIELFSQRGLPQWIKVDNGLPFGSSKQDTIPILAMWVMSLGVKVIWNRPRQPQDNAKVERSQGILARWSETDRSLNPSMLKAQLQKAITCHNQYYPVSRLRNKTRIQAFPQLLQHTGRAYQPEKASIQSILDLLARQSWERRVSKKGQINLFNHRFLIGAPYKHQWVNIHLNPLNNHWIIYDQNARQIKSVPTRITLENIRKLNITYK